MFEAALHRHPMTREQRQLRGMAGEPLERGKPVHGRELPDRIHASVKVEGRKARARLADLGDAQADLVSHFRERIGGHGRPPLI
jgi:hypothetical protein